MAFLFFLFVTVSLTELYLIIEVSGAIGWEFTIGWSILTGLAGSWLAKQEGRRTMASIQQRMAQMQMPGQELADALLIVISGALLITPGFLTDVIGFTILFPVTRSLYRAGIGKWFKTRVGFNQFYQQNSNAFEHTDIFGQADPWDSIVEGEILDDDEDKNDYIEGEIVSE
ncbi:MAG: FxsA family protein [Planctomycetaceae bacterium]|jgi:UPF0716 protein FxsA|nr:FxsA family protein [Planctomycetaceae bacterium]